MMKEDFIILLKFQKTKTQIDQANVKKKNNIILYYVQLLNVLQPIRRRGAYSVVLIWG